MPKVTYESDIIYMTLYTITPLLKAHQAAIQKTGVWTQECPLPLDRLQNVTFPHYTFGNKQQKGSVIVLDVVAFYVAKIFESLFQKKFPIQQAYPIEKYKGDDDVSMEANNTSAFNFRPIAGQKTLSIHSYGLAIDVNPVQNPFVKSPQPHPNKKCSLVEVWPSQGPAFMNRACAHPGMVEPIVKVFHRYGFRDWGGLWESPIDLHHFATFRNIADFLISIPYKEGKAFFKWYVGQSHDHKETDFLGLYQKDPQKFWDQLQYL